MWPPACGQKQPCKGAAKQELSADMTIYDHYEEARAIAEALGREGRLSKAKQILDAMADAGSGTEVFMALRHRVALLLNAAPLPSATDRRSRVLYSKLNEALA